MTDAHAPKDVYHKLNLVVQCLSIPIVSAAVALRFYTRFRFKQRLGVEDCEFNAQPSWILVSLHSTDIDHRHVHYSLGMLCMTSFETELSID